MNIVPMRVPDAWVCTPKIFSDGRGSFLEWFRSDMLGELTGRRFDVQQANHSVSRRGTLRGLHYADVPPGQAKFVYCLRGAVLDVVVDIRTGSPTYGAVATGLLDDINRQAVFLAEGLGHAFLALTDDTTVAYLTSTTYNPNAEHTINALDPQLAVQWPDGIDLVLSPRDAIAPTLAEAEARGLLPSYEDCTKQYAAVSV